MYIGICLDDVPFTLKEYTNKYSLVIYNNNLNYVHVVQLVTQASKLSAREGRKGNIGS